MIVSYHVGGVTQTGSFEPDRGPTLTRPAAFAMGLGNGSTQFFEPFVGLFTYGILEKHPRLKLCSGESVVRVGSRTWSRRWTTASTAKLETKSRDEFPLKRMPSSEIFREQVWATYQQDRVGLALRDFFGEDKMMWASDYPHPDSTWPDSQSIVEAETAGLPEDAKRRILRDNAKKLYGI